MIEKKSLASLLMIGGFAFSQIGFASPVSVLGKSSQGSRIVGGVKATPGEFPFIVSLQARSWGGHFCGGSLIQSGWVLTAAHCVKDTVPASELRIVIGLHQLSKPTNVETFKVKKILIHPEYESKTESDFDYALIQLSGNSQHTPIAIHTTEVDIPELENESPLATTAGWGTTQMNGNVSDTLMKVSVPLVSAKRCEEAYPQQITDRMICGGYEQGGKDSCQGDSGGPLMITSATGEKTLAGVVSWGEGCALAKKYGVYSKVNFVSQWIENTVKAN